jgi:hypothetical protein
LCNSRIKFGTFFEHLEAHFPGQFDRIASGHYAQLCRERCLDDDVPPLATAAAASFTSHLEAVQECSSSRASKADLSRHDALQHHSRFGAIDALDDGATWSVSNTGTGAPGAVEISTTRIGAAMAEPSAECLAKADNASARRTSSSSSQQGQAFAGRRQAAQATTRSPPVVTGIQHPRPTSVETGADPFRREHVQLRLTRDDVKDQTYFLAHLTQQQLSRVMFPLGPLTKADTRWLAQQLHLPTDTRKDSQGLCFLGKVKFNEFIKVCHTLISLVTPCKTQTPWISWLSCMIVFAIQR